MNNNTGKKRNHTKPEKEMLRGRGHITFLMTCSLADYNNNTKEMNEKGYLTIQELLRHKMKKPL